MGVYDVAIVGCGAFGAAAASRLAWGGVNAVAVDGWGAPHAWGSSHGHTRMTRTAYYERAEYVPLLLRAHEMWREFEAGSGETLLEMCGGLYLGAADSDLITGSRGAAEMHGLEHELLPRVELRERFPQFAMPEGWVGLLEKKAGYLLVERCVGAMMEAALVAGLDLKTGSAVSRIDEVVGGVELVLENGETVKARKAIVTAGAWVSKLLPKLPRVTPTRQVLTWIWPDDAVRFSGGPVWAFDVGGGRLLYGFPMLSERPGLKSALHAPGAVTDPELVDRAIRAPDIDEVRSLLRMHVPSAAEGPLLHAATCLYENSPDGHFLLGHVSDRIIVGGGGSGHGFKFAPVIGQILVELAMTGRTRWDVGFLSPARFGAA